MDITGGSFHIFKPFSVPREEAAIFWKVSSKNLSLITKLQHLRGVKTNPIKLSLGLAGETKLFSSNAFGLRRCTELPVASPWCGDVFRHSLPQVNPLHQQLVEHKNWWTLCPVLGLQQPPDHDRAATVEHANGRSSSHMKKPHYVTHRITMEILRYFRNQREPLLHSDIQQFSSREIVKRY